MIGVSVASGLEGGSAQADFDSLIDLIQSSVEADSWTENGTGEGEISPFPTGVFVDARGTLRFTQTSLGLGKGTGTFFLRRLRKNEPVPDGSWFIVRLRE